MTASQYAVIDAPGHYGDFARVYSVHRTLEAAKRAVNRDKSGLALAVIERGGLSRGGKVHALDAARYGRYVADRSR